MVDWASIRSELVWVYEGAVEARYRWAREHFPGCSALLLKQGSLLVETEHGQTRATKGQWIFPCSGPRLQQFSDEAEVISLHFKFQWPGGAPVFAWKVAELIESSKVPHLEQQARQMLTIVDQRIPASGAGMLWQNAEIQTHLMLHVAFTKWLLIFVQAMLDAGHVVSRQGPMDSRTERAMQILEALPLDSKFDKARLATEIGLSPSQLDRVFAKQFGVTPRQYLDQRRLTRSLEMMQSSALSIKQIASELGFHSQPFFSRWFRSHTGNSPLQYVRSHR